MTHEEMKNIRLFDCETLADVDIKNEKARQKAIDEYRKYQAYYCNPLKDEYLGKVDEINSKYSSSEKDLPIVKFKKNLNKYILISTIIFLIIFVTTCSEGYEEIGGIFGIGVLLNIGIVFLEYIYLDNCINKIIIRYRASKQDEKIFLLDNLAKEYSDKGLRLDYASTPSFCPASYTHYYAPRSQKRPDGSQYIIASQFYMCALTKSIEGDDEWDEEKHEWQYMPCDTRFWCNGYKNNSHL